MIRSAILPILSSKTMSGVFIATVSFFFYYGEGATLDYLLGTIAGDSLRRELLLNFVGL